MREHSRPVAKLLRRNIRDLERALRRCRRALVAVDPSVNGHASTNGRVRPAPTPTSSNGTRSQRTTPSARTRAPRARLTNEEKERRDEIKRTQGMWRELAKRLGSRPAPSAETTDQLWREAMGRPNGTNQEEDHAGQRQAAA